MSDTSKRYAIIDGFGVVVNVCQWSTDSQWQPPPGCRMALAETSGNIGDRHDGTTFIPQPKPAPEPAPQSVAELLAERLIATGQLKREEFDEIKVRAKGRL